MRGVFLIMVLIAMLIVGLLTKKRHEQKIVVPGVGDVPTAAVDADKAAAAIKKRMDAETMKLNRDLEGASRGGD